MNESKKMNLEGAVMKTLALFGFAVLLAVACYASVVAVRMAPETLKTMSRGLSVAAVSLSGIFVPAEKLTVTVENATVTSGVPFTLSYTHKGKRTEGSYVISFDCRDGVSLDMAKGDGAYALVTCDHASTTIPSTETKDTVRMIALSIKNRYIDVPVSVSFVKKNGDAPISDRVLVTIVNSTIADSKSTTASTTKPVVTTPTGTSGNTTVANPSTGGTTAGTPSTTVRPIVTTPTVPVSNPNGQADLAVTFLDFGYVDNANGAFISSSTPFANQKLAVRFSIANNGTKATGETWQFSAVLPTLPSYIFQSDAQRSLEPGDRIEYTLAFDNVIQDQSLLPITVNADANGRVNEKDKANNLVTKSFIVTKTR